MLERTLSQSPVDDLVESATHRNNTTRVKSFTPLRYGQKDPIIRNPRLLRVRNLPDTTEAKDLLQFLNQVFHDLASPSKVSSSQQPTDCIQNILVHDRVAILGCCSSRCVDSILQSLRDESFGPIVYRGKPLDIGRPRNYGVEGTEHTKERDKKERSMEGMVIVVAKRLDRS